MNHCIKIFGITQEIIDVIGNLREQSVPFIVREFNIHNVPRIYSSRAIIRIWQSISSYYYIVNDTISIYVRERDYAMVRLMVPNSVNVKLKV